MKVTIFENTHLDLHMWLYAIDLVNVSRKGISALQLQREIGMGSYESVWRILHQIRKTMDNEEYKETFETIVEINKTYMGGKPRKDNKHDDNDKDDENKQLSGKQLSIHTNGIESFWAVLKRGVYGIFHNVSVKCMQWYVDEFCCCLNYRDEEEVFQCLVNLAVK